MSFSFVSGKLQEARPAVGSASCLTQREQRNEAGVNKGKERMKLQLIAS
jgi:hypothetical protein